MSNPPVQPPNPDGPKPGEQPAAGAGQNSPQYGQQPPSAPQYGQQAPPVPQYGQAPPAPQYGQNAPQYGQQAPQPPQYGQNASSAPQYGQNLPAYGKGDYGQSPYAQYPSGQPQGPVGAPKLVNTAFWLLVASGVLWVLSLLLSLGMIDSPEMRRQFEEQMAAGGAQIDFNDIKGFLVGTILVMAAIGAGLYALVAFNIRKGKNWARILGTVLAALSIVSLLPLGLNTVSVLAGIAAMVMLYLPATSPYFKKQQPFANPYGQPGSPFGS
ncbi:MAG: hypothetical protein JWO49_1018 [Arthrobacter sp.]|nr:hypothetical protein [Arthrobacter sp.]MCU1549417.1 hypothetical protein [Arthrobacter sp.]